MSKKSLEGVRVAAFTHFAAGPIAAQYLGALGADVIKVESPNRDLNRYAVRDPDDALRGTSPYFVCTNRNQRDIVLDLKSSAGLTVAKQLVASVDVVLENYRPGVMDKLGLGYDDCKTLKSNVIYCSFSAYDAKGPARDRPGQDLLLQALSGLASLSGRADHPPVPVGAYVIDGFTAMQGVVGITSALLHRHATGEGQWVRADMMSSALYMMMQEASFALNVGSMTERSRDGVAHTNHGAPYGIYEAQDGYIAVSVFGGDEAVRQLAIALGIEDELNQYLTERGLKVHRDTIAALFGRQIKQLTMKQATELLTTAGAWIAPVRNLEEALDDPAVQASHIIRDFYMPGVGKHRAVTEPLQMSETPLLRSCPAPDFGEHSYEILSELGYTSTEIQRLIDSESIVGPSGTDLAHLD